MEANDDARLYFTAAAFFVGMMLFLNTNLGKKLLGLD